MRSYLVVGNQTLGGPALTAAIAERTASGDPTHFHVVVPATPIQDGFTWDEDKAPGGRAGAARGDARPAATLGVEASGEVGHKDPVEAARDAMRSIRSMRWSTVDSAGGDLALARPGRTDATEGRRAGPGGGGDREIDQEPGWSLLRRAPSRSRDGALAVPSHDGVPFGTVRG